MAYCLRLPREATTMVEELRSHWVDLAGLRAAGGTPSARCVKGFEITFNRYGLGNGITIEAKSLEVHVKRTFCAAKDPCQRCAGLMAADTDDVWHCNRCQARPIWMGGRANTIFFSRLERRGFTWD